MKAIEQAVPQYEALVENPDTTDEIREEAEYTLMKIKASLQYYEFLDLLVTQFKSGNLAQDIIERYKREN
ncbi:hypothetical protein [Bacillus sp. JCM 19041]|uniref:hypothetical protein n=1 Tax=Bacillus sp. JCM 19041 TaxID=1460637 RepID=UPI0018D03B28